MYKIYFSHWLAFHRYNCYIGNKANIQFLMKELKDYVYIDKGYHKGQSEKIYDIIKRNNGRIVSLDEEGGIDYSDGSTLLGRYSEGLFDNAEVIFLWGSKQHDLIKRNYSSKGKIVITGHPRFELLKPQFHCLYENDVKTIKDKFNNFFLVNTNMSFGNNIRGDEFVAINYASRFKDIDRIIKNDKMKLHVFKSLILKLTKTLNKNIVIRPHPEEDHSFYIDAFRNFPNIFIIYEGSVIPWLLAADLMIHPDCTTAIESMILGKKSISFLPELYPEDITTHLPLSASRCFTNESKLVSYIKGRDCNLESDFDLKDFPFLEEYFSISQETTKLIIDNLICFLREKTSVCKNNLSQVIKMKLFVQQIKRKLKRDNKDKLIRKKISGFTEKNVFSYSGIIKKCHPELNNIRINKLNKYLYYIN